jgi:hypothetical protein
LLRLCELFFIAPGHGIVMVIFLLALLPVAVRVQMASSTSYSALEAFWNDVTVHGKSAIVTSQLHHNQVTTL